jgi:hypothetical protein
VRNVVGGCTCTYSAHDCASSCWASVTGFSPDDLRGKWFRRWGLAPAGLRSTGLDTAIAGGEIGDARVAEDRKVSDSMEGNVVMEGKCLVIRTQSCCQ